MASLAILAKEMENNNDIENDQRVELQNINDSLKSILVVNEGIKSLIQKQIDQNRQNQLELADRLAETRDSGSGPGVAANDNKEMDGKGILGAIAAAMLGLSAIKALIGGMIAGLIVSFKSWIKLVDGLFLGMFSKIGELIKGGVEKLKLRFTTFLDDFIKLFDPVVDFFKNTKANISARTTTILDTIADAFKPVTTFIDNLKVGFTRYGTQATGMFDDILKVEDFTTLAGKIGAGFKAVVNAFIAPIQALQLGPDFAIIGETISDFFKPIIDSVKNFFSAEGPIGRFFSTIKSVFSFADEGSVLMKALGAVGRVVGKLFLPFAAIMTLWDTISGAFSGFIDDEGNLGSKVLSALEGGISGFLNSIIGIPLDLLKSGISWIAGKLGFTEAEKALDSFSFEDLIDQGVNAIFGFFRNMIDGIIEGIATLVEGFEIDLPIIGKKRIGSKAAADSVRNLKLGPGLTPGMKADNLADPSGGLDIDWTKRMPEAFGIKPNHQPRLYEEGAVDPDDISGRVVPRGIPESSQQLGQRSAAEKPIIPIIAPSDNRDQRQYPTYNMSSTSSAGEEPAPRPNRLGAGWE
jgi:hypothetical protein